MNRLKKITATGIGIALFVVLSVCLQVPVFENYYLCLGYIAMIVYLYNVDTISGTAVGVLGTILYCVLISGLRGVPGWAIGNIAIGVILGPYFAARKKKEFTTVNLKARIAILDAILIIVAVGIGILGIKSIVEVILYAQPFFVRIAKNFNAFVADCVVIYLSIPVAAAVSKAYKKIYNG